MLDGGDFIGFGHPVEGSTDARPVPRLFKGHFQRYFPYAPPGGGREYFAGELSIPAPAGLSGGVLAYTQHPDNAVAVVTANMDSPLILDSYEILERNGAVERGEIRRVVSYGIAATLFTFEDWLRENSQPLPYPPEQQHPGVVS